MNKLVQQEDKNWAAYVAGMIETYIKQSPSLAIREKAIAGIIERRMCFIRAETVAWQYRRNYGNEWSTWRNADPVDLDTYKRRAKEDPGTWQLRELTVRK